MNPQNKGIYPNWVNDKDIINQVLNEIIKQGGRLPYTYVVNSEHNQEIRTRMKGLVENMLAEKLILISTGESTFLEIDIEGSRAINMGYRKYHRIKKWDGLRQTFGRISYILLILVGLAIIAGVAYFLWHFFK